MAHNRIRSSLPLDFAASAFWSVHGTDNETVDNVLDGRWQPGDDSDGPRFGADDGILLFDERGIRISGNTITNVRDCGTENVGLLAE